MTSSRPRLSGVLSPPVTLAPPAHVSCRSCAGPERANHPRKAHRRRETSALAAQESYLGTLAHEAGEDVPGNLTKAQASGLIDRLQGRSERLKDS